MYRSHASNAMSRKGMFIQVKLLVVAVGILVIVGLLGYIFMVHFGGWDMLTGWIGGAGGALLGLTGDATDALPDPDIGGVADGIPGVDTGGEEDAPEEVIEEFEEFIDSVNAACSGELDGDALGTFDFSQVDSIAVAEDPRWSSWYTNQFTANGDGWDIQREAEECDAAVWCEDVFLDALPFGLSLDACVGWYSPPGPISFSEDQGIRYNLDGESIELERDDVDEDELDADDLDEEYDVQECGTDNTCWEGDECPGSMIRDEDGDADCDDGGICCALDPRIQ